MTPLALEKIVALAEAKLDESSPRYRDYDLPPLAIARATIGSLAPAIEHALAITRLDDRASILVRIAEIVRGRRFEATPELTTAITRLKAHI